MIAGDESSPEGFSLDLGQALTIFSFLRRSEGDLPPPVMDLYCRLSKHLYQHVSIEDIENPESLLARIGSRR